jgi:hypothetical protein
MISISPGIISVARRMEKIRFLPGKRSLEKAKAARTVVTRVQTVLITVTITELKKYLAKGAAFKALP